MGKKRLCNPAEALLKLRLARPAMRVTVCGQAIGILILASLPAGQKAVVFQHENKQ